jgi:hypothetical protein
LAFDTKISEKRKSTSPNVKQVKISDINIEEKLGVIKADLKNMNEFFTYDVMLGTLVLVYIHFIIMLIEL